MAVAADHHVHLFSPSVLERVRPVTDEFAPGSAGRRHSHVVGRGPALSVDRADPQLMGEWSSVVTGV